MPKRFTPEYKRQCVERWFNHQHLNNSFHQKINPVTASKLKITKSVIN